MDKPKEVILALPLNTMTMQGRPSDDLKPRMGSGIGEPCDPCPTITRSHSHAVCLTLGAQTVVRRIAPQESEALQGFPPGHTAVPHGSSESSDAVRYRAVGNSMAVACITWIGLRIDGSQPR